MINNGPSPINWTIASNIGTPDYFSPYYSISGFSTPVNVRGSEAPYHGVSYFGFNVLHLSRGQSREYMQTQLLSPLVPDERYEVEFYLSLADSFHLAVSDQDIGIYFSDTLMPNNFDHEVREFRPFYISDSAWDATNKMGWEKFHYTYKAQGGENYMIIGCFKRNREVTQDSVGKGGSFDWMRRGSYYYIDNISVMLYDSTSSIKEVDLAEQLMAYPNPVSESFYVESSVKEKLDFRLYNQLGQGIRFRQQRISNRYVFDLTHLARGIYLLQVIAGEQSTSLKIIKD